MEGWKSYGPDVLYSTWHLYTKLSLKYSSDRHCTELIKGKIILQLPGTKSWFLCTELLRVVLHLYTKFHYIISYSLEDMLRTKCVGHTNGRSSTITIIIKFVFRKGIIIRNFCRRTKRQTDRHVNYYSIRRTHSFTLHAFLLESFENFVSSKYACTLKSQMYMPHFYICEVFGRMFLSFCEEFG